MSDRVVPTVLHSCRGGGAHRFDYPMQTIEIHLEDGRTICIQQVADDAYYGAPYVVLLAAGNETDLDVKSMEPEEMYLGLPTD